MDEPGELEERATELLRAAEDAAAAKGRAMVAEARAVRARMLEDAERRRTEVRVELERALRVIQEALVALDVHEEGAEPAAGVGTEPESAAATSPREPDPDTVTPDPRIDDVFAKLREAPPEPPAPKPKPPKAPKAKKTATPEPAPDAPPAPPEAEDASAVAEPDAAAEAPKPTGDDAVRARRDAVLAPLLPGLLRAAKRLLQDEQNVLLDAVRRARQRVEPSRLLPEPVHHRDAWAAVLGSATDVAYASGRTSGGRKRRPTNAPPRVLNELAAGLVAPLRERLTVTINAVVAEGPYASPAELHRELAGAIGARYREWKAGDLERHLGDVLTAAYSRGAYDATPSGALLRWVPERPGQCPDCDDDALEPTVKGQAFPTGQQYPPAHPGCRCLVVPVVSDDSSG